MPSPRAAPRMSTSSGNSRTQALMFKHDRRGMMIMSNKKRNEEIRRLAKKESLLAKAPFDRVVREVMDEDYSARYKLSSSEARDAMRAAADNYLHKLFLCAGWVAEHRGRTTVVPDDLKFVRAIWEGEIVFFAEEEEI